jgi:2'-5' RNA ligase
MPESSLAGGRTRERRRRLFFALWPSSARQREIEVTMRGRVEASRGRAIPAENLHVTLVFLGSVVESRFERVLRAAEQVRSAPFDLAFDQIEVWARSRVLCLTTSALPSSLAQLEEQLRFKLLSEQFDIRQEEYRPHVTLARDVARRNTREAIASIGWSVEDFVLVESRPGRSGSTYTVVERWPL